MTAAKDGYISIHNAKNQHQPIKQLTVDFPPDHVAIVFNKENTKFASIGNYGSVISIWDSNSFTISNSIGTKGFILWDLIYSPKSWELIAVTTDCSLRFYDTRIKGGSLIRNVTQVHRGAITSLCFSNNSEYFITGG